MREMWRSVSPRQRALYLKTLPFARDLGRRAIEMATIQMEECEFSEGEHLLTEGQPIPGIYILTAGRVSLHQQDSEVGQISAPGRVGLIGLLAAGRQGAADGAPGDIVAESSVEALHLPADLVDHMLTDNFEFLLGLTRWIAMQLRSPRQACLFVSRCEDLQDLTPPFDLFSRTRWFAESSLFDEANLEAILELVRRVETVRYAEGTTIWEAGEQSDEILGVVQGHIDIVESGSDPAGPGEFVGVAEVFGGDFHLHTARAAEPVVGLTLEMGVLLEVMEDHSNMSLGLMRTLAAAGVERRWADSYNAQNSSRSPEVDPRPKATLEFGAYDPVE